MTAPRLFISYSWSSPAHEQTVINLATELRESGVDVILDKWDLKEGHDSVAFMEQMVTNSDLKKVAIISDRVYAEKADGRAGGVGTETQIISKEVYDKQSQEKFVAIVTEKDEEGKPYLPTYYKSRIYIDLSEADQYAENFEKLLRWVFDKRLHVKPELGNRPTFLSDEGDHLSLGTSPIFKRCIDALKTSKPYATSTLTDYCLTFVANLERFRLAKPSGEVDDMVVKNIEEFLPFRNEVVQVFTTVARYAPSEENVKILHSFFEGLIPYLNRPPHVNQWQDWEFDNYRFIVHELFLYCIAVLLKHDRIEAAVQFLSQEYYVPGNSDCGKDVMMSFVVMQEVVRSFGYRNQRLKLNRLSLRADILKQRCVGLGIDFRDLMQADFLAFMRNEVLDTEQKYRWWPDTLVYIGYKGSSPFEIFSRSTSRAYFGRTRHLLGIESPKDLELLLTSYQEGTRRLPRWEFDSFSPAQLLGYEKLCTRP